MCGKDITVNECHTKCLSTETQGWGSSYSCTSFEDEMENSERQEIMAYRGRETVSLKDILVRFLSLNADKPQPI